MTLRAELSHGDGIGDSANKRFENVYLSYVWTPVKNIDYGLETSYQTREVADGRDGDALRFQGMVRYRF